MNIRNLIKGIVRISGPKDSASPFVYPFVSLLIFQFCFTNSITLFAFLQVFFLISFRI